jgi:hypothetical protein
MSDVEMPLEGVEAESGSEEIGETGIEAVTEDITEEPTYDFLEVDETTANKYVKVKVDGEEVSVPLNEALQGYSRESAATKRFQEASDMRKEAERAIRLQQAFQTDPGLTVQILAREAGVSVEEFLGMSPAQQQAAIDDANDQYVDPLERQIAEERQARLAIEERLAQRDADERLQRAVGGLKQQYSATDEQVRSVVQQAMNMQLGVEAFPMIFQAMAYQASQQVSAQQTAGQEAETLRRQEAARRAAAVVGTGSGAANTTTASPAATYSSIREAAAAAIDEVEARAAR